MHAVESPEPASYHTDVLGVGLEENHLEHTTVFTEQISNKQQHDIIFTSQNETCDRLTAWIFFLSWALARERLLETEFR